MSWEQIPGWTDEHIQGLYDAAIASATDGALFVEIGVAFGRSLAYAASRILESGKAIRLVGIDNFAVERWDEPELTALIQKHGGSCEACLATIREHAPRTLEVAAIVKEASLIASTRWALGAVDFCFIDGWHDELSVSTDIEAWRKWMRPGGVMSGHDHTPNYPGVERAVRSAFGADYEIRGTCWRKVIP